MSDSAATEQTGLTPLEAAVLDLELAGDDPQRAVLREQLRRARVIERRFTGVGFFTDFEVPADAPRLAASRLVFGDVYADIEGLKHGAGFIVFVEDGRLSCLEGYAHEPTWPAEITRFSLRCERDPRRPRLS